MMNDGTKSPLFAIRPSGLAEPNAIYLPEIYRLWTWLHA